MMPGDWRKWAVPAPVFFAQIFPRIFGMGIAAVQKSFPAVSADELETFIRVAIAGDNVIAGS
jgi:hypothetical protein